mmetsp:Transcript_10673/g.41438  ORF Transcript_10673/g.41438 Transcript_10673/m.41438 type:complete len:335 (-) Transcript_10673:1946-2950(-)
MAVNIRTASSTTAVMVGRSVGTPLGRSVGGAGRSSPRSACWRAAASQGFTGQPSFSPRPVTARMVEKSMSSAASMRWASSLLPGAWGPFAAASASLFTKSVMRSGGTTPTNVSTTRPPTTPNTAGMLCTRSAPASCFSSSTLTFARRSLPWDPATSRSSMGPSCLQGPHQGAQASTMTGTGELTTSLSNVSFVTSTMGANAPPAGPLPAAWGPALGSRSAGATEKVRAPGCARAAPARAAVPATVRAGAAARTPQARAAAAETRASLLAIAARVWSEVLSVVSACQGTTGGAWLQSRGASRRFEARQQCNHPLPGRPAAHGRRVLQRAVQLSPG